MTCKITVPAVSGTYEIRIGEGLLESNPFLHALTSEPMLLVSNTTVGPLYARRLAEKLQKPYLEVPDGEQFKTVETWQTIIDAAVANGLNRHSVMVAVGGGVVTDLVGFAAATYMRGIRYISIPTSLLAMVDAAVGGKTGVNIPEGKNLIGAFHQPFGVLIDVSTIDTLPEREYRAGLAEVVKYALALDADFLDWLETHIDQIKARDANVLVELIAHCCRLKRNVVIEDERETGKRALLNLGHTVGHALEAATDYADFLHGEAVAIGMIAELAIAETVLGIALPIERVRSLLAALGLPTKWRGELSKLLPFMYKDKKNTGGKVYFVLCETIGRAKCCPVVLDDNMLETIRCAIDAM